ncbi:MULTISPECIES: amidohydrolase family protein [unclassified Curtobacterium]|uniref:amidohydrolase family protein n=1 Tax=unclassified Curtobacterium TaxID=257496 RepID=UPI00226B7998|nr:MULTISPECIES: amidohydrolase family protein [unclassified Curtobacterium]
MTSTTISNVRVFDGGRTLENQTVTIEGTTIASVRSTSADDQTHSETHMVIDGTGRTLMPGLIDAHTHSSLDALRLALRFGVTTELEMGGVLTAPNREDIVTDDDLADVRSSGFGLTPPGGHPFEIIPEGSFPGEGEPGFGDVVMPLATTPEQAVAFIPQLIASGSDYVKFLIEDGSTANAPGLPMLDQATLNAGVAEAQRLGMTTLAHTLTVGATRMALEAGIDGLAHLFVDEAPTPEVIDLIAAAGVFVVPCIVLNSSIVGVTGAAFGADPRVSARLDPQWLLTLQSAINHYPAGAVDDVLATVRALHDAGVPILVGTDASAPDPALGGLAHGASVHHELQMLVRAGMRPADALAAATSVPARHFGLTDRGRIAEGLRADLLLVDGDPTSTISDTLNITAVWRRGTQVRM